MAALLPACCWTFPMSESLRKTKSSCPRQRRHSIVDFGDFDGWKTKGARMSNPTPRQLAQSGTLEELYSKLSPIRMGAGWAKPTPSLWAEPKKNFQPFVWSYA